MWKRLVFALALVGFVGLRAEAADTTLQQIADALDVSTTKTFQFTANGSMYSLGQSTNPAAPWPRAFVKSFTRVYDFSAGAMRDDAVRMAAEPPTVGPEQRVVTAVRVMEALTDRILHRSATKRLPFCFRLFAAHGYSNLRCLRKLTDQEGLYDAKIAATGGVQLPPSFHDGTCIRSDAFLSG